MMRRNLSPPQCNQVNRCFLPCLDEEKLITKCEIKYLMKSLCHNSTFQTTYYPHVNRNLSLERNSPWLICNLDCFMSFRKKNSDFITIIFHTFLPDIFYKLKDENNAISQWFTREEVKGLSNFTLRWPAHKEEKGDRSVQ